MKKFLVMLVAVLGLPSLLSAAVYEKKGKTTTEIKKEVVKKPTAKCDAKSLAMFKTGRGFGECVTNCRKHHREIGCKHGELRGRCWKICDKTHPIKARKTVRTKAKYQPVKKTTTHTRTYGVAGKV